AAIAAREGVPRPLLAAIAQVEACDDAACAQGRASALRKKADFIFTEYPDLREDRLGDWLEAVMLSSPDPDWRHAAEYADLVYAQLEERVELPFPLGASFLRAANYSEGRELPVEYIVIHDMEGSYER